MANADGSVIFSCDLDSTKAQKKLSKLRDEISELNKVGVEIMGKEHRGLVGPRGRLRQTPGNQQGQQEKRCEHSGHSPPQPPHETSLLSVCSRHSAKTALQDFILP